MPELINIYGIESLQGKLGSTIRAIQNLRPAFESMSGGVIGEFKANFPAKGGRLDSPWAPRKKEQPWPLLVNTGRLKGNWSDKAEARSLTIANPTPYSPYLHYGTKHMPARKLVGASTKINSIIADKIINYLKQYL